MNLSYDFDVDAGAHGVDEELVATRPGCLADVVKNRFTTNDGFVWLCLRPGYYLGKVVSGSKRQHAERSVTVRAQQTVGDVVNGTIAANRNDYVRSIIRKLARDFNAVLWRIGQVDLGIDTASAEFSDDCVALTKRASATRRRVDDEVCARHRNMLDRYRRRRNISAHESENTLKPGRERNLVTIALMAGQFLAAVESTAVATAMPTAVADLGGISHYSWAFSAYLLTSTLTVPLFGRLADIHGRLKIYLLCTAIFILGSGLCGAASSFGWLVAFRALQGVGAGGVIPVSVTLIGDIYTLEERGRMQGFFSGVWGFASIAGPVVGGAVTDSFSWRWVFYFTIPFALISALMLRWYLIEHGMQDAERERAFLPLDIFRNKVIAVSSAGSCLLGCVLFAVTAYVPMYAHNNLGGTASDAGAALIPLMLSWPIASTLSGRWMLKIGYRPLVRAGAFISLVGLVYLAVAMHTRGQLMATMAVIGFGMGTMSTPYLVAMQNAVPWNRRGVVTSASQFFRTIGGSFMTAFNAAAPVMFIACAVVATMQMGIALLFPSGAAADLGHTGNSVPH